MSETQKTQRYPGAVYAAAGFTDLAAEKLRGLPDRVVGLSERARSEIASGRAQNELAELGGKLGSGLATVRDRAQHLNSDEVRADLRRFQDSARRRANELADAAARNLATAQDRASHLYDGLVSRGASVLDGPSAELTEVPEPAPKKKMAKKAVKKTQ